jgi:hypothetical protein
MYNVLVIIWTLNNYKNLTFIRDISLSPAGVHSPMVIKTITGDKGTHLWKRRWVSAVHIGPIQMTIISVMYNLYWRTYIFHPFKYLYFDSIMAHVRHNWPCLWVLFVVFLPKMAENAETYSGLPRVCILPYLTTVWLLERYGVLSCCAVLGWFQKLRTLLVYFPQYWKLD